MNLVVNFLSMLMTEEENGGVKRMLGVCSEFERIAKAVLDKAEKEQSSRRKRKNNDDQTAKTKPQNPAVANGLPQTPMTTNAQTPAMASVYSPNAVPHQVAQNGFSPTTANGSPNWSQEFNGSEYMTPFPEVRNYSNGNEITSPYSANSFQQPFVPQDLWQMPMTLEYDWADLTGGVYPSFENGIMGDPSLSHADNSHLQHIQQLYQS
jgi:hypothetical protein